MPMSSESHWRRCCHKLTEPTKGDTANEIPTQERVKGSLGSDLGTALRNNPRTLGQEQREPRREGPIGRKEPVGCGYGLTASCRISPAAIPVPKVTALGGGAFGR